MFASVFTRKEPFPSEVAFGYERILSADDMNFIRSHIREVRVSRAKQKQLVAQTNDEVQSYLLIPFSIALYLQDNFQYPHEFEVFKEIAEKQKAKKLEIPEKTNLLLEEIQSYPHAKAWTIVAKRMALEAAYDAVLFKRNPEQEFTKSLDKYANAILSYLSPAKYDINGNLLSLYELERYLNKKFPMSLAKQLNFEEFKKKDALRDVISQYESTDILYAAFPQNELFEMYDLYRRALGFEDIKILTTETLSAHRTFLYQVEEEISKIVAITGLSEAERGSQILCHTDKIYPVTKPEYDKQIEQRTPEIERFIANELKDAVAKIFKGEDSNIGAVWAGLIKEQKDNIQKRIAEGLFSTEGEGKTEEQIVHDWISLRYRHFCHCNIGTKIVEDYFAVHKNEFPLLEIKPTKDAVTLGVFGGVGAGKTTETDRLLQEAGKDPSHYAMYDADALKRTLAVYAYREGVLTGDMDDPKSNWGVRVHRESSNANYEFALKLHEMAKAGTRPDLILNMMSLGAVEADMALEGGASLDAVFITIEIDSVWADVVRRAQKSSEDIQSFSNRLPPESIVRGSHVYANSAIVKSGNYAGKSLNLTFRERKGNNCNNVYAKWDVKNNVLEVSDWLAFSKMAQRAKQKDSYPASLTEFVKDFMLKGTLVVGLNSGKETVFSVNPAGEVVVADGKSAEFDEIKNINNTLFLALQSVKNKLIIGGKIITSASDALAR
jgi:hypothetical protein